MGGSGDSGVVGDDPRGLDGCTVVVTRPEPGELGRLIVAAGGTLVHVPLIETVDPDDGGAELRASTSRLDDFDWLIVTSPTGAQRVGGAARSSPVRLAAVGTATASRLAELAGRPADLVPERQLGDELASAFIAAHDTSQRVLLAVADRAATTLEDRLRAAGHRVERVTAYRTVVRTPESRELDAIAGVDALLLTSGSAAAGWVDALGDRAVAALPPLVIAIGPSTESVARRHGLKVTATATDHSLAGIVDELRRRWRSMTTSSDS